MVVMIVIVMISIAYLHAIALDYTSCIQLISSHMTEQEAKGAYLRQSLEALLLQHLLAGCPDCETQCLLQLRLQQLAQHPGPLPHHQRKLLGDVQQG